MHPPQGANSYGQLGLGNKEDTLLPMTCSQLDGPALPPWDGKQLVQVTGGGGHSILLTGPRAPLGIGSTGPGSPVVYSDTEMKPELQKKSSH